MTVFAWIALAIVVGLAPTNGFAAQSTIPGPSDAAAASERTRLEATARLQAAAAIQGATRARLGVLGDAFVCADARFASYRRSDAEPQFADQWYVASQVWADAVLLHAASGSTGSVGDEGTATPGDASDVPPPVIAGWNPQDTHCYVDKGLIFLDRLWDYSGVGYFPRADPTGTRVDERVHFSDDNFLAGLALLDVARTTTDSFELRQLVHAAEREADFAVVEGSGLWDTTFGGGFWWNTGRGDSEEGKPAQTNALAALFFARLYAATDNPVYREWALRTLLWMDTVLYDPGKHLYRWSVAFADIPSRSGARIAPRYFNYDQSIAIDAQLVATGLDHDANRLTRARDVARALHGAFWADDLGGYDLEAGVNQVYASYGAWTGLGYLSLYDVDHDPAWLELAREDVTALEQRLREADNGFAYRAYRCVDRVAKGCEGGASVAVDRTRDTAAQAWVQHLQAALAERLLTSAR